MKPVLLFLSTLLALAAAHAQAPVTSQRATELRLAVQKSRLVAATASAPRRLTPDERAELRRQVQQVSARPSRP